MKNRAFTLAETLIVIGIIGVVAALTLPNLNHATGDKEKVTKVKKIYSALTDAIDRAQVVYGDLDSWFNDLNCEGDFSQVCSERFAKRVTEFMKVTKDCNFNGGCLEGGLDDSENYYKGYSVLLADGIAIEFCITQYAHGAEIAIDIDGPTKGKNLYGNDIFEFIIYTDEEIANTIEANANLNQLYPAAEPNLWTGDFTSANYYTAWVIENGNLDYLKCPDELNWETQTSCK